MSFDSNSMLDTVRLALRKTGTAFDDEIRLTIDSAIDDMKDAGVDVDSSARASKIKQAIILYSKGTFGYRDDSEKFLSMYRNLRDSLASTIAAGVHTGGDLDG